MKIFAAMQMVRNNLNNFSSSLCRWSIESMKNLFINYKNGEMEGATVFSYHWKNSIEINMNRMTFTIATTQTQKAQIHYKMPRKKKIIVHENWLPLLQ